ncbi:MAG TPA: ECF transporter S component, partial [Clostridiales bacterium]|nr:ECF transporter S component [Clostridiales bacterium]
NIQPATFFVLLSGYVFGPVYGFMVGAVAGLISNSFLGHGPWTPWQMIAWGAAGMSAGLLKKVLSKPKRIPLSIFAFCWGFLYDYIMNLWHWIAFISPHTLSTLIAVNAASFYFDLMHALGNFILMYLFGKNLINVLSRFKDKIHYTEIS